jgi:diaminohydroxyphosphoribosylaminopyrimidine deaminase/5-amino-6-(5-phosphoribosylamino)uracil reductase
MTCDEQFMRQALALARKGCGRTSPNPMVGAVLVKGGTVIGQGWHRRAGGPHAEVAAIRDAGSCLGATLYVSLEPCSTTGKTLPCVEAIKAAGIRRVVVAATDSNPAHAGCAFRKLRRARIEVSRGLLADEAAELNGAFNHWIVRGTPLVTVKAAMTLDGRIATANGESKWITGPAARREGHRLRKGSDAILVGINTVLADDPSLTVKGKLKSRPLRRIILDSRARIPLKARVINDEFSESTTVVVAKGAPARRVNAIARKANVMVAPRKKGRVDLCWLLKRLGREEVASLLVEGGGEVNASFLEVGLAHRVAFFYAPKILGGDDARRAVAGDGSRSLSEAVRLENVSWSRVGVDLMLTARVSGA